MDSLTFNMPKLKYNICTYRASNEVPSKMSLNAEELKSRAQPLTNTDLEIKQGNANDVALIRLYITMRATNGSRPQLILLLSIY